MSDEDRFWSRVDKTEGCWNWIAGCFTNGYGQIQINDYPARAHRVSYEWANGPIPEGMLVLHKCDNRKCVNPNHLFLGTHAENCADRNAKRRQARATGHGMSKLDPEKVLAIRASGATTTELARQYGISRSTAWGVKNGKAWGDLQSQTNVGPA